MRRTLARWGLAVGLAVGMGACASLEETGLPGTAASMAQGRIMWINPEQTSFGAYRLSAHRQRYEELAMFLQQKGQPDFLAETDDEIRRYFILYYVKSKQAYLCRTRAVDRDRLEFSGPYRVTKRELKLLEGMKNP